MVCMDEHAICTGHDIGKIICRRRQELGLTQEALAERIEVTSQQVQRYEHGRNKLYVESLQRIARALDVPVTYFFSEQVAEEQLPKGERLDREERRVVELYRGIGSGEARELAVNVLKAIVQGGKRV